MKILSTYQEDWTYWTDSSWWWYECVCLYNNYNKQCVTHRMTNLNMIPLYIDIYKSMVTS